MSAPGRAIVDAWLAALLSEDEVERARAAHALGKLGKHACGAVGALVRAVEVDDEACVRGTAFRALVAIERAGVNLAPALRGMMVYDAGVRAWLHEQLEARFPAHFARAAS